jgi:hypothetical protein
MRPPDPVTAKILIQAKLESLGVAEPKHGTRRPPRTN